MEFDFVGTVVRWSEAKGYGFVRLLPDGREVFCHTRVLRQAGLGAGLPVGQEVEVDIEPAPDGRLRVARIRAAPPTDQPRGLTAHGPHPEAVLARHGG